MTQNHPRSAQEIHVSLTRNIEKVMRGQSRAIRWLLAGLVGGGHVLLEDFPGTGKTTLAKALALSLDVRFKRIQFTPDLLPSDILGVSIFDQNDKSFRFHQGPIFTNVLLADEINRASPRTQSALLEAMAEGQVSIDGRLHQLENPFFVIATQNPVESRGTYPLPEAQMDRFALKFSLGYVSAEDEAAVLTDQKHRHPLEEIKACAGREDLLFLQEKVKEVQLSEEVKRYIVELVRRTRGADEVQLGASPRASLALMRTVKALALFEGQDFVTPDHVQEIAVQIVAHRLSLDPQARFSGRTAEAVVAEILRAVPVPA
ncbi:MAG: MoxR family ATPase [Thermodesulfobacteriota bacterium]